MSNLLEKFFFEDKNIIEIGIDEAGRGPLFGRVYTSAVILPKYSTTFDYSKVKDSKKFHSKKKIIEVSNYIKENSLAWAVTYEDENTIDKINILQATICSMHSSVQEVIKMYNAKYSEIEQNQEKTFYLLVDGNYFKQINNINYTTIEGGDNKYCCIAAASILAKVERDKYIDDLCDEYPELIEHYNLNKNKGYGAKIHIDGIKKYGITKWHRKTFGICKNY